MSVSVPSDPAPNGYVAFPYEKEAETALAFFRGEVDSTEGWTLISDKGGVKAEKKFLQNDSSPIPLVRGVGIIKSATPRQLVSLVSLPGARIQWDARMEQGDVLEKYARRKQQFYTVQKGGFMVQPRDIVGTQETIVNDDGSIEIYQTSVVDAAKAPEVSGKTRADLRGAGWRIKSVGADSELIYMIKVDPKGSLPTWLVNAIITESPQLVGKVREYYEGTGYLPLITDEATSVIRFETFDHGKREWRAGFIGKAGDAFEVVLDGARLYKKNGFKTVVEGAGKDGVTLTTEGDRVKVAVGEAAVEKPFEIIVRKA